MYNYINILSYNQASESAKSLANILKETFDATYSNQYRVTRYGPDAQFLHRLRANGFKNRQDKTLFLRWGNVKIPEVPETLNNLLILNSCDLTPFVNKKDFFNRFYNEATIRPYLPKFYNATDAQFILNTATITPNQSPIIVERQSLTGHSGEGIRLLGPGNSVDPVNGKLWVRYIKKEREFRAHFFKFGDTIQFHFAEKLLKKSAAQEPLPNRYQIRNYQNGWIFATNGLEPVPQAITRCAERFAEVAGLDFGAIDIIYQKNTGNSYILEVNTAPGIAGNTVTFYKQCIDEMMRSHDWSSNKTRYNPLPTATPLATSDFEDTFDEDEEELPGLLDEIYEEESDNL